MSDWSTLKEARPLHSMNTPAEVSCSNGILEIYWCFPPTTGGVESHVADLAAAMAKRGCRVIVLTGEPNPIRSDLYEIVSASFILFTKRGPTSCGNTPFINYGMATTPRLGMCKNSVKPCLAFRRPYSRLPST